MITASSSRGLERRQPSSTLMSSFSDRNLSDLDTSRHLISEEICA